MANSFLDHLVDVDLEKVDGLRSLAERLATVGLATFQLHSPDADSLLRVASGVGRVVGHRDADARGITSIAAKPVESRGGYGGFSRQDLPVHTDRSGTADPPTLLLMLCHYASPDGGDSTFVDGAELYSTLATTHPDLLLALEASDCATFGGADEPHVTSVFPDLGEDHIGVRFRCDDLASFSPSLSAQLPQLLDLMRELTFGFRLEGGQGYALQNWRWLHGRTGFAGDREAYRALVEVLPGSPIRRGFPRPRGANRSLSLVA